MSVFAEATEMRTEERADYLSRVRLDDQTLYDELVALLLADGRENAFLDKPISVDLDASLVGTRVGPYIIGEELGRGGMGAVFRAFRTDGGFEQDVAIKISNRVLLSADLERRFKNERQILAKLEHANIVHLLDGGVTADKLPYYVMELVEGSPITNYCSENGLGIAERLLLFQQVCSAVNYAHRHLIVHRDLKPSNILVTRNGEVKLLDFGIAKILGGEAQTQTVNAPITPEYASPEQILDTPISTASDIYTLGVVLYELLTGKKPAEIYGVGRTDISRGIREIDPQKPSMNSGGRVLKGDLDNIVLKCLEKDVSRRYASVDQLSSDIDRYLNGYPVTAHSQSFAYRARKFVGRNKLLAAVASVGLILLLATTSIAIWQAVAARREQARAEANFAQVRKIANSLILTYNDEIAKLPGSLQLQERLVSDAVGYLDTISANETADPDLLKEMAIGYRKVASVQGMIYGANLGKTNEAIVNENKGIQLLAKAIELRPDRLDLLDEFATSLSDFAQILTRKSQAVSKFHTLSREILDIALAADPDDLDRRIHWLSVRLLEVGYLVPTEDTMEGDRKGRENYLEVMAKAKELDSKYPNDPRLLNILAVTANRLSNVCRWLGLRYYLTQRRPDLARPLLEESISAMQDAIRFGDQLFKVAPKARSWSRFEFVNNLNIAIALPFLGRFDEAEKYQKTAADLLAKFEKDDPNNIEAKLDELSVVKSQLDIAMLRNQPGNILKIANHGLAILDEYDRLTKSETNIETMIWRGYILNMKMRSLEQLNGDKAEIAGIAATLKKLEHTLTSAGANPDGWSGITIS